MREPDVAVAVRMIEAAARRLAEHEQELSRLDGAAGDGDHGANMTAAFADALLRLEKNPPAEPSGAWRAVSGAFLENAGGAAGGLFGAFFAAVASALEGRKYVEPDQMAAALSRGLERVRRAGRAAPGQKTMLDALSPAVKVAGESAALREEMSTILRVAAMAARRGAEATAEMRAAAGRARYAPDRSQGTPDPGAVSVALLFEAWADAVPPRPLMI